MRQSVAFFLAGVFSSLARSLRRHVRPVFFGDARSPNPTIKTIGRYDFWQLFYTSLSIAAVQVTLNFTVAPFIVLDLDKSLSAYAGMWWYGVILAASGFAAFKAGAGKWFDQRSGRVRRDKGITSASDVTEDEEAIASRRANKARAANAKDAAVNGTKRSAGELKVADVDAMGQADADTLRNAATDLGQEIKDTVDHVHRQARSEL